MCLLLEASRSLHLDQLLLEAVAWASCNCWYIRSPFHCVRPRTFYLFTPRSLQQQGGPVFCMGFWFAVLVAKAIQISIVSLSVHPWWLLEIPPPPWIISSWSAPVRRACSCVTVRCRVISMDRHWLHRESIQKDTVPYGCSKGSPALGHLLTERLLHLARR